MHPVSASIPSNEQAPNKEKKPSIDLRSSQELAAMSKEEIAEEYKKLQITVITRGARNEMLENDLEETKKSYAISLAQATNRQAVANITQNRRNRADYTTMTQNTTISNVGRIVSLVVSIAALIITFICILI